MILQLLRVGLNRIRGNTLYVNAVYLIFSTMVIALTGFIFWAIVTRTYPSVSVGIATTLLAVSNLLSLLGLAGFDTTLVRFLPKTLRKNDHINTALIVAAVLSCGLAFIVGLILPHTSSSLYLLRQPLALAAFVFFTVATTLNTLTNAVFLAFKQAKNIFLITAIFSGCKVFLPLIAHGHSALNIFVLAGTAQFIGLVVSIIWMRKTCNYKYKLTVDRQALKEIKGFSTAMYIASILNLLPPTLLPLIVVNFLGPRPAAYYYMAFTIASALYTIAYSSTQSVLAEGSHNESLLKMHIAKAGWMVAAMLIPASLITALISGPLLRIFGAEYAKGASWLLQLLALSSILVAVYSGLSAVFKVAKKLYGIVIMNIVFAGLNILVSVWLLPSRGLAAVGWAWIAGNFMACIVGTLFLIKFKGGTVNGTVTDTGQRR